eukprot:COSAG06_NODE_1757_length_8456_cov_13.708867_10_plen_178_part_00
MRVEKGTIGARSAAVIINLGGPFPPHPCSASRCSSRVSGLTCSSVRLPTVDPTAARPPDRGSRPSCSAALFRRSAPKHTVVRPGAGVVSTSCLWHRHRQRRLLSAPTIPRRLQAAAAPAAAPKTAAARMTVCWLLTVTRGLLPAAGWLAPPEHPPRDEWPMPRLTPGASAKGASAAP